MNIFTKRNAIVGYLVVNGLQRKRWARRRRGMKIAAYMALGLVSMGILAALVAVALRRQRGTEELGAAESDEQEFGELSADDELGAALPEPGFAA